MRKIPEKVKDKGESSIRGHTTAPTYAYRLSAGAAEKLDEQIRRLQCHASSGAILYWGGVARLPLLTSLSARIIPGLSIFK